MQHRNAAELALPETCSARAGFDRAAKSFASASFLHAEARRRLLERVDDLSIEPAVCVDLGAALGEGARELRHRFPAASIVAIDSSFQMLRRAGGNDAARVSADATALPFADGSIDLLFANMVLPWARPDLVFAEARRVLAASGVIVFSTLGPDSLGEIRRAWAQADGAIHVHGGFDMQTLGDLVMRAGLAEPVLDVDRLRISYRGLSAAIRDLRACGGTNTAAGRQRGLTGRGRWQRFVEALWRDQGQGLKGRIHLTAELIFGQAFGVPAATGREAPRGEVRVPIDAISRRGLGHKGK